MKKCSQCKENKESSEFWNNASCKDGLQPWCKECTMAYERTDAHKEKKSLRDKKRNMNIRDVVLEYYGETCSCCGEENKEFLCIDHIDGGGNQERKTQGEGSNFYRSLVKRNFPQGYRTLCHNCNASLGHYGYCPHKKHIDYRS